MADPPAISIVMPVFNPKEKWLRAAIDSILSHAYLHWELCIADDASAPMAKEVPAEYERLDKCIQVTCRETNGQVSTASNAALAMAKGVFFVS